MSSDNIIDYDERIHQLADQVWSLQDKIKIQNADILAFKDALKEIPQQIVNVAGQVGVPAITTSLFNIYQSYRSLGWKSQVGIGLTTGVAAAYPIYKVADTVKYVGETGVSAVKYVGTLPEAIITSTQETIKNVTETTSSTLKDLILLGLVGIFILTISNSGDNKKGHGNINIKY